MTPRILLVEDDLRAAAATQRELARAGFTDVTCVCAPDGESAWGRVCVGIKQYDVVITDGLDGYCSGVAAAFGESGTIIYTGTPDWYDSLAAQVVSKPDGAALIAAVRAVLEKKNTKEVQDG